MAGRMEKETDKFFTTPNGLLLFSYQIDSCVFFVDSLLAFDFFFCFGLFYCCEAGRRVERGDGNLRNLFHLIQQLMYCDSSFYGQEGLTFGAHAGQSIIE